MAMTREETRARSLNVGQAVELKNTITGTSSKVTIIAKNNDGYQVQSINGTDDVFIEYSLLESGALEAVVLNDERVNPFNVVEDSQDNEPEIPFPSREEEEVEIRSFSESYSAFKADIQFEFNNIESQIDALCNAPFNSDTFIQEYNNLIDDFNDAINTKINVFITRISRGEFGQIHPENRNSIAHEMREISKKKDDLIIEYKNKFEKELNKHIFDIRALTTPKQEKLFIKPDFISIFKYFKNKNYLEKLSYQDIINFIEIIKLNNNSVIQKEFGDIVPKIISKFFNILFKLDKIELVENKRYNLIIKGDEIKNVRISKSLYKEFGKVLFVKEVNGKDIIIDINNELIFNIDIKEIEMDNDIEAPEDMLSVSMEIFNIEKPVEGIINKEILDNFKSVFSFSQETIDKIVKFISGYFLVHPEELEKYNGITLDPEIFPIYEYRKKLLKDENDSSNEG